VADYSFTDEVTAGVRFCDTETLDQSYFLALFDRTLPPEYLAPFKAYPDAGYELFQAFAAVGERVAASIRHLECGSFVIFSEDAAIAFTDVTFTRPTLTAGALTIKAGTVVRAPQGGREFVLAADLAFTGSDLSKTGRVFAVAAGFEWNVRGERTTARGETVPGEITEIKLLLTDPPYAEPAFTVSQSADASGGVAPTLNGLGADRGIARHPGEPADVYRVRVRSLPDTVSPGAIRRTVTAILNPYGIAFDFIETWMITYQTCWDAPSPNPGTPTYQATPPTNPLFDSTLFVYDDPRPEWPLRNVWLDYIEHRGAFTIVLEPTSLLETGLAYDDPGMMPIDFRDPLTGWGRSTPAFDLDGSMDATLVYGSAYDGFDLLYGSLAAGLWTTLQNIRAAGVAAIVERRRS